MKKTVVIASIVALASAAAIATFALGGGPKIKPVFEAKATSRNFTFDADHGTEKFENVPFAQTIDVTTGVSDPIHTEVAPEGIESLTFGQNGRFVEAHPMFEHCGYVLQIGINNLTHFEIDMGVINDAGTVDKYRIELRDQSRNVVKEWRDCPFELNGTAHLEWDKGPTDGTVVEVYVSLQIMDDSAEESCSYVNSLSLAWNC